MQAFRSRARAILAISCFGLLAIPYSCVYGWDAQIRPAARLDLPTTIDGNSAAFWKEGKFHLFSSTGNPLMVSQAANQFGAWHSDPVDLTYQEHVPLWVEGSWADPSGPVLIWYHHEPGGVCEGSELTAPKIGAAISYDGGKAMYDLGIVLESGDPIDCSAENGFFAGGHGDFSVVLDRERKYFYFLFTNYGGPVEQQGVAIARLAYEDRWDPVGKVRKFFDDKWEEPGLGGGVTPIFQTKTDWRRAAADSFWGPSIHFNRYLNTFVVLMNHACCEPRWPQEGIYVSFAPDISNPRGWVTPKKILDSSQLPEMPGYYPQVLGLGPLDTDIMAGRVARLYIHGISEWDLVFMREDPLNEADPSKDKQAEQTEIP